MTARASERVKTTGILGGRFARATLIISTAKKMAPRNGAFAPTTAGQVTSKKEE
jgi:hypothetical protein